MAGVDYHDQMMSYYSCRHKTLRWYKKLGIHLIQTMLLNFYLYNSQNEKKMTLYDFRLGVIEKLLGPPPSSTIVSIKGTHLPIFCPKDDLGKTKRKRCKYCWTISHERKDSIFYCPECPDQPGFCLITCFGKYHNY
jgi:hypothetical protein